MGLTSDQVSLIKSTVPILSQYGKIITTTFYDNMLSEHPELNNIFNRTSQANGQQASALAGSLYAYASYIDDLGVLAPAVEKIVQKHVSLYVQPEQYDIVGSYLLKAMKTVLGDALTEEIQTAVRISSFQFFPHSFALQVLLSYGLGHGATVPLSTTSPSYCNFSVERRVPFSGICF